MVSVVHRTFADYRYAPHPYNATDFNLTPEDDPVGGPTQPSSNIHRFRGLYTFPWPPMSSQGPTAPVHAHIMIRLEVLYKYHPGPLPSPVTENIKVPPGPGPDRGAPPGAGPGAPSGRADSRAT